MTKTINRSLHTIFIFILLGILAASCSPRALPPSPTPSSVAETTSPPPSPSPSPVPVTETAHPTFTPAPDPTPTLTLQPPGVDFAVIGDYGLEGPAEQDVSQLIKSWSPDVIITTGDNNYPRGSAETMDDNVGQYFHEYIHPYRGFYGEGADQNRFFPSIGNHDWRWPEPGPYLTYFNLPGNERYYDFVWGPVHFFALNSIVHEPDGTAPTSTQAQWLKKELQRSRLPWKIVYMHHPPFSSGPHGSTLRMQWPYSSWGASAVIAGHDHNYERLMVEGFPYFVNGLGGNGSYGFEEILSHSSVRYRADYGAMRVTADREQMTFQFITRAGEIIDTFRLEKDP